MVALCAGLTFGACSTDSGPAGITAGGGVAKLCHDLRRQGTPITLTLEFGSPALARLSAATGTCTPAVGIPCAAIPVGRVPLALLEDDRIVATRTVILRDKEEYLFQPVVTADGRVAIGGGALGTDRCAPLDFPAPDGGIDDGAREGGRAADTAMPDTNSRD